MIDPKKIERFTENALERAKKKEEDKAKRLKLNKEEYIKLKKSCEYIFNLPEGQIFAKAFMRMSGIYSARKNNNNLYEIGVERGKEQLYLFFIKGLLPTRIVMEIESRAEVENETD